MKLFRSRIFALFLAVLIVAACTLANTHIRLGRSANAVEQLFYNGVVQTGENYKNPALSELLEDSAASALGITSVTAVRTDLDAETAAVREARIALRHALDAVDIPGAYQANETLKASMTALTTAVQRVGIEDNNRLQYNTNLRDFNEAQGAILRYTRGYNDSVTSFNRTVYNAFPTKQLASLSGVKPPAAFE